MFYRPKKRRGTCKTPSECLNGMVYWPQDSKCYTLHTRGPCVKGKLITLGKNRIAECKVCDRIIVFSNNFNNYFWILIGCSAIMMVIWLNIIIKMVHAMNILQLDHVRAMVNYFYQAEDAAAM